MHAAVKVLLGLIMIILGLGLFADSAIPIIGERGTFGIDWIYNFVVVVTGVIPMFLILLGLFVVWLELDELKAQKELSRETEVKVEVKKEEKK